MLAQLQGAGGESVGCQELRQRHRATTMQWYHKLRQGFDFRTGTHCPLLLWSIGLTILLIQAGAPLLAAPSESKAKTQPRASTKPILPPQAGAWAVVIFSRGGVTGVGAGGITITSRGDVSVRADSCRAQLPASQVLELDQAVRSASPSAWRSGYPQTEGSRITDPLQWFLTLRRRGTDGAEEVAKASWSHNSVKRPDDLVAVHKAALKLKSNVEKGCKN